MKKEERNQTLQEQVTRAMEENYTQKPVEVEFTNVEKMHHRTNNLDSFLSFLASITVTTSMVIGLNQYKPLDVSNLNINEEIFHSRRKQPQAQMRTDPNQHMHGINSMDENGIKRITLLEQNADQKDSPGIHVGDVYEIGEERVNLYPPTKYNLDGTPVVEEPDTLYHGQQLVVTKVIDPHGRLYEKPGISCEDLGYTDQAKVYQIQQSTSNGNLVSQPIHLAKSGLSDDIKYVVSYVIRDPKDIGNTVTNSNGEPIISPSLEKTTVIPSRMLNIITNNPIKTTQPEAGRSR